MTKNEVSDDLDGINEASSTGQAWTWTRDSATSTGGAESLIQTTLVAEPWQMEETAAEVQVHLTVSWSPGANVPCWTTSSPQPASGGLEIRRGDRLQPSS